MIELCGSDPSDRCVIFTHGCHPVLVYRYDGQGISADFVGQARQQLRRYLGEKIHCQFLQGFCGNVRPRVVADIQAGRFVTARPDQVEAAGGQLADDIITAMAHSAEPMAWRFTVAEDFCRVPRDQSDAEKIARELAANPNEPQRRMGEYWLRRIRSGPPLEEHVPWLIGLIRLDDRHLLVHMSGEPVAEWMEHLTAALAPYPVIGLGYCHDAVSYFPTDELRVEGGYESLRAMPLFRGGPGPFAFGMNEHVCRHVQMLLK